MVQLVSSYIQIKANQVKMAQLGKVIAETIMSKLKDIHY